MPIPTLTPEASELFAALVALDPRLKPRKMFGNPAAFVNGNLCCGAFGGDIFLRLGSPDLAAASALRGVRPFEPMAGRPMRGYLVFPTGLLRDPAESRRWLGRAVAFTQSLPKKGKSA